MCVCVCVCVCVLCRLDGHDGVGPKTSESESGAASRSLAPILSFAAPPAPHPRTRVLRAAPRDACLALSTESPLGRVSVGPLSRDRPSPTAFPHPARQQRFFFLLPMSAPPGPSAWERPGGLSASRGNARFLQVDGLRVKYVGASVWERSGRREREGGWGAAAFVVVGAADPMPLRGSAPRAHLDHAL